MDDTGVEKLMQEARELLKRAGGKTSFLTGALADVVQILEGHTPTMRAKFAPILVERIQDVKKELGDG